jgi:hypothetical protein
MTGVRLRSGSGWKLLGDKSRLYWGRSSVSQQTLQEVVSLPCLVQLGVVMDENHTVAVKTWTHCSHCNSSYFQAWPVCQVGCHGELSQPCSFCAYARNHMTVNPRALCHIYQQLLKSQWIMNLWYVADREIHSTQGKRKTCVIAFCPLHIPLRMGSNPHIHSEKPGTNRWTLAWRHKIRILD